MQLICSVSDFKPGCVSFHSERPEYLAQLQREHWDPIINWARERFGIEINTTTTIMFDPQPEVTKEALDKVMQGFDKWQMAGVYYFVQDWKNKILKNVCSHGTGNLYDEVIPYCPCLGLETDNSRASSPRLPS